jgi:phage terminase large subunit-like protein
MVRADRELIDLLHVNDVQRIIKHRVTAAELKIVAADTGVVGGKKAGFVLVDELWIFGKKAGADAMLEEATGGQAARPEGWTLYLSTHSDEAPAGVFKTKLAYFRDVRDGVVEDPTTLPMLYEWPEEMLESEAYRDPANFYVTNPNIGKSPTVEFIQRKINQAEAGEGEDEDASIQVVFAKYLNVEIGLRMRRDRWAGANLWLDAAEPGLTLDTLIARCEVLVMGSTAAAGMTCSGVCGGA